MKIVSTIKSKSFWYDIFQWVVVFFMIFMVINIFKGWISNWFWLLVFPFQGLASWLGMEVTHEVEIKKKN